MPVSNGTLLTALHGIVLGGLFLLAYSRGLLGLYSLRPGWVTLTGYRGLIRCLSAGTWIMALVAWSTVLSGTYLILPQYMAEEVPARPTGPHPIERRGHGVEDAPGLDGSRAGDGRRVCRLALWAAPGRLPPRCAGLSR